MKNRKEPQSELNKKIVQDLRNGKSVIDVVKEYGITNANASQLKVRYVDMPTELPCNMRKLSALQDIKYSGLTLVQISKKYEMSQNTINMLKAKYLNSPAWDLITAPTVNEEVTAVVKSDVQEREPTITRKWLENGQCGGCGKSGSVRITIQNGPYGIGFALCKRCLNLLNSEVIATLD